MHVTGFSAATILVFAIASPSRTQGIEVFGPAQQNRRRADRNLGSRRAFLSGKVVSAVSFHRKRTAENYRRGYSLRSATLGSTAAALRAGK
jgi:hypothetical protein